jgi:hypothetical protein
MLSKSNLNLAGMHDLRFRWQQMMSGLDYTYIRNIEYLQSREGSMENKRTGFYIPIDCDLVIRFPELKRLNFLSSYHIVISAMLFHSSSPSRDTLLFHWHWRFWYWYWREHHAFVPIDHIIISDTFTLAYKLILKDLPSDCLTLVLSN